LSKIIPIAHTIINVNYICHKAANMTAIIKVIIAALKYINRGRFRSEWS
jgi:hypothetical protein